MNHKKIAVVIVLSLVLLSTANAIYAEDREYSIVDALIDLTIHNDGLLHVNEKRSLCHCLDKETVCGGEHL